MSEFEKIFQTRNPIEFDHIASILEAESIEYFAGESGDIFEAMPLEEITVRSADAPAALRAIARALIFAERPDLALDTDEELATGLQALSADAKRSVDELGSDSRNQLLLYLAKKMNIKLRF